MAKRRALGIDVSKWQGNVDFKKAKSAGASFAFIKASQNVWYDSKFQQNWANARNAKIIRGAYHFFDMRDGSKSAKEQARYFANLLKDDMGELRPVLDFESPGVNGYPSLPDHDTCVRHVTDFMNTFYKQTNLYPMLYTNLAGIQRLSPLSRFLSAKELWIAWYYLKSRTPKIGTWPRWRFWQYKTTGNGIAFGAESKGLDMNVLNGTETNLYQYVNALGISKTKYTFTKSAADYLPDLLRGETAHELNDPQVIID
ncbi:MAG: hypothetical protein GX933_05250 [Chloroflexi bacterium]|jgi:lysozyme|nr:hypothetical protein [Chloroflexota bacterium]